MTRKGILEILNGCEINSLEFGGVVGVKKGVIYMDGKILNLTDNKLVTLYHEYVAQELGDEY